MNEEITEDMAEFMKQKNGYQDLLHRSDMITDEETAVLISRLLTFENCHLVANIIANSKPLIGRALRNELNIYIQGK